MSIRVALEHTHLLPVRPPGRARAAHGAPAPRAALPHADPGLLAAGRRRSDHFLNWQQDPFGQPPRPARVPRAGRRELTVTVDLVADMTVINPFDFFVDESAEHVPVRYDPDLARDLAPVPASREPAARCSDACGSPRVAAAPRAAIDRLPGRRSTGACCGERRLLDPHGARRPDARRDAAPRRRLLPRQRVAARADPAHGSASPRASSSGYLVQLSADDVARRPDGPSRLHRPARLGRGRTSPAPAGSASTRPPACSPARATSRSRARRAPRRAAPIAGAIERRREARLRRTPTSVPRLARGPARHRALHREQLGARSTRSARAVDDALRERRRPPHDGRRADVRRRSTTSDEPEWSIAGRRRRRSAARRAAARRAGDALRAGRAAPCTARASGTPASRCRAGQIAVLLAHATASRSGTTRRCSPSPARRPARPTPRGRGAARARALAAALGLPAERCARRVRGPARRRAWRRGERCPRRRSTRATTGSALPTRPPRRGRSPPWRRPRRRLGRAAAAPPTGRAALGDRALACGAAAVPASRRLADRPAAAAGLAACGTPPSRADRRSPASTRCRAAEPRRLGGRPSVGRRRRRARSITALCVEVRDGHAAACSCRRWSDDGRRAGAGRRRRGAAPRELRPAGRRSRATRRRATPALRRFERHARPRRHRGQHPPGAHRGRELDEQHDDAVRGRAPRAGLGDREVHARRPPHRHRRRQPPHARRRRRRRQPVAAPARPAAQPASRYWQHHPSLSYLFSGRFIGPTSQAPRVDEARDDSLYELEIAFAELDRLERRGTPRRRGWSTALLRNLLVDLTGNTHRAEFCIDKLFARTPSRPPRPASSCARSRCRRTRGWPRAGAARARARRALLATSRTAAPLVRWGTELHDRFLLPHFVAADIARRASRDLRRARLPVRRRLARRRSSSSASRASGVSHVDGVDARAAPGDRAVARARARRSPAAAPRATSTRRSSALQVQVDGLTSVAARGHLQRPARAAAADGDAGDVRRRRALPRLAAALRAAPDDRRPRPLVFDVVDRWSGRALGGCTYHVVHPGGRSVRDLPGQRRRGRGPPREPLRGARPHAWPGRDPAGAGSRRASAHPGSQARVTTTEDVSEALARLGVEELRRRQGEATRLIDQDGVVYRDASGPRGGRRRWRLDPMPVVLDSGAWAEIESGIIERAELLDLVLTDLYGPRELLRRRLIPPEVVLGHPGFLHACDGIRLPGEHQLFNYAADLGRCDDGRLRRPRGPHAGAVRLGLRDGEPAGLPAGAADALPRRRRAPARAVLPLAARRRCRPPRRPTSRTRGSSSSARARTTRPPSSTPSWRPRSGTRSSRAPTSPSAAVRCGCGRSASASRST